MVLTYFIIYKKKIISLCENYELNWNQARCHCLQFSLLGYPLNIQFLVRTQLQEVCKSEPFRLGPTKLFIYRLWAYTIPKLGCYLDIIGPNSFMIGPVTWFGPFLHQALTTRFTLPRPRPGETIKIRF